MKKRNFGIMLMLLLVCTSCVTFSDTHYYKDKINDVTLPNYYKVRIHGYSFFTSSRYLSGYFDQTAVNIYFNETEQPDKATFIKKDEKVDYFKETGNELVIIFSTRAKAVSNNISNISNNQSILNSVYSMATKGKLSDYYAIKDEAQKVDISVSTYKYLVGSAIEELKKTDDREKRRELFNKIISYQNN